MFLPIKSIFFSTKGRFFPSLLILLGLIFFVRMLLLNIHCSPKLIEMTQIFLLTVLFLLEQVTSLLLLLLHLLASLNLQPIVNNQIFFPPPKGGTAIKFVDNQIIYWCTAHAKSWYSTVFVNTGQWVTHKSSECPLQKLKDNKKEGNKSDVSNLWLLLMWHLQRPQLFLQIQKLEINLVHLLQQAKYFQCVPNSRPWSSMPMSQKWQACMLQLRPTSFLMVRTSDNMVWHNTGIILRYFHCWFVSHCCLCTFMAT